MASCSTLKNLAASSTTLKHITPEFAVFYVLAPFALAHDAIATKPDTLNFRQTNYGAWVFTPEVSLGPAHRSHAPPLLS